MEIQVLGAHCCESINTKLTSLLIDDVLALDAGGLTSSLSPQAQQKVKAILLTHQHLDHIKDVALIGYFQALLVEAGLAHKPKLIYSTTKILDALSAHILNDENFPDFTESPSKVKPALRFCPLEPYKPETIEEYTVVVIPVKHAVPAYGYQVSKEGKCLFYTGDTGPGLSTCWEYASPQLLITEVSGSNRFSKQAIEVGHLTPQLIKEELIEFHQHKGYFPRVILVHITPMLEGEIRGEIDEVAKELGADIKLGYEGMKISL